MSLGNYTELQAAIATELNKDNLTAAIPDFIKRAEAKLNRRARFRVMEQQAYTDYDATMTTRRIALPDDFIEMLKLWAKKASATDSTYERLQFVGSDRMVDYYDSDLCRYTLRADLELNTAVTETYRLLMHYYKRLDIATDATNGVLTNHPDLYLYGSLAEAEMYLRNDPRVPMWKALFDEGIMELNERDERSRDDAELDLGDIAELTRPRTFDILRG